MNADEILNRIVLSICALFTLFAFWGVLVVFLSLETLNGHNDTSKESASDKPAARKEVPKSRVVSA